MFNKNYIYFKQGLKIVVIAKIINSLYIVTYVLKKYKDTAFAEIKIRKTATGDESETATATGNKSKDKAIKENELKRYLKYY